MPPHDYKLYISALPWLTVIVKKFEKIGKIAFLHTFENISTDTYSGCISTSWERSFHMQTDFADA